jgi:hypothetical protein
MERRDLLAGCQRFDDNDLMSFQQSRDLVADGRQRRTLDFDQPTAFVNGINPILIDHDFVSVFSGDVV